MGKTVETYIQLIAMVLVIGSVLFFLVDYLSSASINVNAKVVQRTYAPSQTSYGWSTDDSGNSQRVSTRSKERWMVIISSKYGTEGVEVLPELYSKIKEDDTVDVTCYFGSITGIHYRTIIVRIADE